MLYVTRTDNFYKEVSDVIVSKFSDRMGMEVTILTKKFQVL